MVSWVTNEAFGYHLGAYVMLSLKLAKVITECPSMHMHV